MSTLVLFLPLGSAPGPATEYGYTLTTDGHAATRHDSARASLLPDPGRAGEVVAVVPIQAPVMAARHAAPGRAGAAPARGARRAAGRAAAGRSRAAAFRAGAGRAAGRAGLGGRVRPELAARGTAGPGGRGPAGAAGGARVRAGHRGGTCVLRDRHARGTAAGGHGTGHGGRTVRAAAVACRPPAHGRCARHGRVRRGRR